MIFAARYLHVDLPTCQVNDFWRVKDGTPLQSGAPEFASGDVESPQ
jgi:hypothetical protein